MCCECGRNPCHSRCPNFDEGQYLHEHCAICDTAIFLGEDRPYDDNFYLINNDYVCEDCLEEYCEKHFKGVAA